MLPMPTNDVVFCASAEKLFVGLKDLRQVQRWNLTTLELEKSVPAAQSGIGAMATGANANGPVLLVGGKRFWQLDPTALAATPRLW